jgi:uncharacterized membrane-anchored protein YitT (DUF2179 family)
MKPTITKIILDSVLLLVGTTIMALAYVLFLVPHKVVPGGVTGLAMIGNHLWGLPIGLTSIALNVPLFVLGIKVLGRVYGLKSVVGMLLSSGLIDLFTYLVPLEPATDNLMLACIFGGILLGGGLGLVFKTGGSTGGTDIVGQVLSRCSNLTTGSAILVVDFGIIALAGWGYGDVELVLYGLLNLYLQTRAIDLVLEGVSTTRAVLVVSERTDEIARAINEKLRRGATLLSGKGSWTAADRTVILSVMSRKEVAACREVVRRIDPHAFVIITDVYEVLGEGFRARNGLAV